MIRLKLQTIAGLAAVLLYLSLASGFVPGSERLAISLSFLIGPLAVVGMVSLHRTLRRPGESLLRDGGIVLLIAAFVLFDLMMIVQQTLFSFRGEALAAAASEAARDQIRSSYGVVNGVQLGMDIAFDVFYALGMLLISVTMWKDVRFGRILSTLGVLSATGLLVLNLVTFPQPPATAGLVDLGPVTGLWWIAVIIVSQRSAT